MPARPAIDATFTIAPPSWASMARAASRLIRKVPRRCTSSTRSKASTAWSSVARACSPMPALLTSTSSRLKRSSTAPTQAITSASTDTSQRKPRCVSPSSAAPRDAASPSRSAIATR